MDRRGARRAAAFVFTLALLTLLLSVYVALVYHGDFEQGAEWVVTLDFGEWIAVFAVILAVLFLILLVLFAAPTGTTEAGPLDLEVECAQCRKSYVIEDSGSRPLYHACPHCSYTNVLGEGSTPAPEMEAPIMAPPAGAMASEAQVEDTEEQVVEREEGGVLKKFLVLRCGACSTQFETPYSAERPLITSCANCGRKGILRARAGTGAPSGRPVSEIEGIGSEYSKRLSDAGVRTIPELRAADATILSVTADIPVEMVREWQAMAQLMEVKGIGPQYSELLVKSGIMSLDELRTADPDDLLTRIDAATADRGVRLQGNPVGKKTVKNWISAAKKAA